MISSIFLQLPPLFILAIAQMAGIYVHFFVNDNYIAISLTLIFLLTTASYKKKCEWKIILFPIVFFMSGYNYQYQKNKHVLFIECMHDKTVNLYGIVENIVNNKSSYLPLCIQIKTYSIKDGTACSLHNKNILIYMHDKRNIRISDAIHITDCVIKKPDNTDYTNFLIKENIAGTIFLNKSNYDIIKKPLTIKRYLFEKRQLIIESLKKSLKKDSFVLFSSLFLGNKHICKEEINSISNDFKKWGISHYLARSGLHLIVFTLIWQIILRFIPISFALKQILLILITLFYSLFTWTSVSFLRALYSFFICRIYFLLKKSYIFLNILGAVCLALLTNNPYQLFFLDFQLSFILTFALAWHTNVMRSIK